MRITPLLLPLLISVGCAEELYIYDPGDEPVEVIEPGWVIWVADDNDVDFTNGVVGELVVKVAWNAYGEAVPAVWGVHERTDPVSWAVVLPETAYAQVRGDVSLIQREDTLLLSLQRCQFRPYSASPWWRCGMLLDLDRGRGTVDIMGNVLEGFVYKQSPEVTAAISGP
jgi:hypothetical protein